MRFQASIDAADEIGLAVVATTFSIVAVFLPVGLMPGISGQFFKTFGFTVVIAVLISLLVARMITPMVAAYFLKGRGPAEHGGGKPMDIYMKVLRWTLDRGKAREMRAALQPAHCASAIGWSSSCSSSWSWPPSPPLWSALGKLLATIAMWAWLRMVLSFVLALVVGYGVARLLSLGIRAIGSGVGRYHEFFLGRWRARGHDHRIWIMGVGTLALLFTVLAFATLPFTFFPTEDRDSSRANIQMPPGATLEQTEAVGGPRRRLPPLAARGPDRDRICERRRRA